jgi:hypothetical protein
MPHREKKDKEKEREKKGKHSGCVARGKGGIEPRYYEGP